MSSQLYTLLYVSANGTLLSEEGSVSMKRSSNAQMIKTTNKGMAGMSPGAPTVEIEIDSAVPAVGLEFDMGQYIQAVAPVEIGILNSSGQRAIVQAFITEDTIKHSVDSPSAYSFSAVGPMPQWQ